MNLQNHKFFEADISRIAFRHGITNWESEEFTYLGIGEGLRKAELPEKELSRIASELSDGNKLIEKLIHQGYSNTEISFN